MGATLARIGALAVLTIALTTTLVTAAPQRQQSGLKAIHHVDMNRRQAWGCQDELRVSRRPSHFLERKTPSARYRWWLATWWGGQRQFYCGQVSRMNRWPALAVVYVFGRVHEGGKALDVSRCESDYYPRDGQPDTVARNGQYLGILQMGEHERATCGHGETALRQAFAALCWWHRTGDDWGAWSCA